MQIGELIQVIDFKGRKLLRKVVEICGKTVYLCSEEEYALAAKLGREPTCVGFDQQFVVPSHGETDS
jgi:hypothetical protein